MNKDQIKQIKKDATENVLNVGYNHSIFNDVDSRELIYLIYDILESFGITLFSNEHQFMNYVLQEYIKNSSYQHFKNDLMKHLIGVQSKHKKPLNKNR